ncbi:hypothetical protein GCM10027610_087920 [Dactylosporangium cerinum]
MFDAGQPDFNWDNPVVREEFEDILRFWFDRGVDGIRIDSAAMVVKDPALPDFDPASPPDPHPWNDRDEIHDVYRGWRRVADSYPGERALIGEVWLADQQRFALYLRPDELHAAFNFDFLGCPWDAKALRRCVDETLDAHAAVGAPATWVLSNHDVTRHVTRYGRVETGFEHDLRQTRHLAPTDLALGTRRARAAALLTMALPGSVYVYQGEELGLPEVEDLPAAARQDPFFARTGGADPGRDGCRVPLPWSGTAPPYGFGGDGWLPSRRTGHSGRSRRSPPTRPRCSTCTAGPSPCATPNPASATAPWRGSTHPPTSSPSPATAASRASSTCPAPRSTCPPAWSCSPAATSTTAGCPWTPRPGCACPDPRRGGAPPPPRRHRSDRQPGPGCGRVGDCRGHRITVETPSGSGSPLFGRFPAVLIQLGRRADSLVGDGTAKARWLRFAHS